MYMYLCVTTLKRICTHPSGVCDVYCLRNGPILSLGIGASCRKTMHSVIHSGHFYSAPSSPLLLRGAPDYSTGTVTEFHAEAHRQLQAMDLPKVPTWRLERELNPRPSD